jgi:hypothetical protein
MSTTASVTAMDLDNLFNMQIILVAALVAPSGQVLRRHAVPARHLGHDRARRIRLRHDPPLDLVARPPATSRTDLHLHPAPRLRSVNYIVNHICEPNRM